MLTFARLSIETCAAIALAMLAAAALATAATPRFKSLASAPSLDVTVPMAFGDWKAVPQVGAQVSVSHGVEAAYDQPYDQTVMRTYVNTTGEAVMLALAWGERQRQDIKVHRPEVCYPAQGYQVFNLQPGNPLSVAGRSQPVPTVTLLAGTRGSLEAVRYWIRIGNSYGGDGLKARWYILQEGLNGRIPDGILVRASQRIRTAEDVPRANQVMEQFLIALTEAVPPSTRAMLVQ